MAFDPKKFREVVLQLLFSQNFSLTEGKETALWLMEELKVPKKQALEALRSAQSILEKADALDQKIASCVSGYRFERISNVEKNVLRLAVYELLFSPHLDRKIVLSEALRLTRKFSTPEGAQFVLAVLDRFLKEKNGSE